MHNNSQGWSLIWRMHPVGGERLDSSATKITSAGREPGTPFPSCTFSLLRGAHLSSVLVGRFCQRGHLVNLSCWGNVGLATALTPALFVHYSCTCYARQALPPEGRSCKALLLESSEPTHSVPHRSDHALLLKNLSPCRMLLLEG